MTARSLLFLLIAIGAVVTADAADFIVCESKYALCTTAPCTPIPGKDGWVSCQCNVVTGYSAGMKPCQPVQDTAEGQRVNSRYHPIQSYALCSNNRPWAWCLDSPCVIDRNNPSQAACACSIVANQGDYVIVSATGTYDDSSCTTGLYSSARVTDLNQVTDFLRTHGGPLRPVPIKVYTGK
jgi:hypothetical protein